MMNKRSALLATALAAGLTGTAGAADDAAPSILSYDTPAPETGGYEVDDPRTERLDALLDAVEPLDLSDPAIRSTVDPLVVTIESYANDRRFFEARTTLTHGRLVVVNDQGAAMTTDANGDLYDASGPTLFANQ